MNRFFVFQENGKTTIVKPALTGTLLPGITRDTLLVLARSLGSAAEERRLTVDGCRAGIASGAIGEMFACGAAAVITPVGRVKGIDIDLTINAMGNGPVAMQLRDVLLDSSMALRPTRTPGCTG